MDTDTVEDRADRTTGDNTGTRSRRAQQNYTGSVFTLNRVRNGLLDARHAEEVLLRFLNTLSDSGRNFLRLAVANTNHAIAITDDHKSREGETTSTLHNLGHTVNGDNVLDELVLVVTVATVTATSATFATTSAATAFVRLVVLLSLCLLILVFFAHRFSPPSRAPSATAATRPW